MRRVITRLKRTGLFRLWGRLWPVAPEREPLPTFDASLVEAHLNLVELYLQDDRALEALAVVKHVTQLGSQIARAHHLAGRAYVKLDSLARAEAEFERCLMLDPTNQDSEYDLSLVKIARGKLGDARTLLEDVWLKDPTDPRPQLILAELNRLRALA